MPVGEVCSSISDTYREKKNMVTLINTSDVLEGRLLNHERVPNSNLKGQFKKTFQRDDILYSEIRPQNRRFAYVDFSPIDYIASTKLMVIRAKKDVVSPKYLYYFLKNSSTVAELQLLAETRSGTFPQITFSEVANLTIPVPSLAVQEVIVQTMQCLEDKITCNEQINDNLQQQAAALFSSLYDRSNTEVRFTDLIQILGGGTPKTGENTYWNGNIAFFTPKDVGIPYTLITEKTISKEGLSHCNSRLYPVNTVFVTARGTVGKVGMSGVPMAMNQSCYALVGKETHQLLVYFYTLKAVDRLKHKASGAVFDAITTRDFESEQIMKLSDDDATAFLRVAEPMFQEVLNNNIENLRLSTLRDSLLPKLMSGEIDVSAVQL
ncbi:restriction endonuclease subunit S [Clostridiaceae bacterium NSJ-31]|uniref:Restriction endonuclease subunit S n=2 Tax=Ligaoa zhengdingensis TaxID=2763658 RepID=A0A926E1R1_9FIRM|nr:restriction endonuclease subunit S [Ligaoa zhengdingensis]